ncbi:hypothetical protein [Hyalangium minutum]|uniref:Uncharacterized protein n=1 Tax=Hyalangium minutum TaxID=394096 RepID=A0A085WPN5_9BACT|nr:hypothetical protein [Hyalangium minutum]KFE69648.1 hypothetical protein DB31_6623 [Hyalangium minutum]
MILARWMLCFALLAPTAVLAQDSRSGAPASSEEEPSVSPPPLVSAPGEAADTSSQEEAPPRGESIPYSYPGDALDEFQPPGRPGLPTVGRITLEIMGGAAAGALSGLVAFLAAEALSGGSCGDDPGCIITGLGMTAGAIFFTAPLGVYAVGQLAGGQGSYWTSLLGMAVGTGAGGIMVAVFSNKSGELQLASIVTLPILGAVLGYELWNAHQQPDIVRPARTGATGASLQLIPLAGITPGGGVFGGIAARF